MNARHVATKLISVFLLTFACLNAGGAMCLTICITSGGPEELSTSSTHHCERARDESRDRRVSLVQDRDAKPCPMTASLLGGPIERSVVTTLKPLPAAVPFPGRFTTSLPQFHTTRSAISYRGPPPLDRRDRRIMNSVLLI